VATNVVSLGGTALLGGVLGTDEAGRQLRYLLAQADVRVEGLIADAGRPTTTKTRIIAHSQQVVRVDSETRAPISPAAQDALLQWAADQMPHVGACVLSDYLKGVLTPDFTRQFFALARTHQKPVIVDPKGTDYSRYRGATVLKPNFRELEQLIHRDIGDEAQLKQAAGEALALLEGSALLVSRGAEGMSLFLADGGQVRIPPVIRPVYDTTGAGDTVVCTLALALGAGHTLETAARLANHAAGIVVGKLGTACVTLEELRQDLVAHESE
jgi:D-beta-D-heptose 7-phosphate kinase/D-beta-D-heptose 1-phosphate adenosyltransferase